MDFKGQTAIITGGAGALGSATAKTLAEKGANLVIADINVEAAEAVAQSVPSAISFELDTSSAEQNRACVDEAVKKFGSVDIFLANAGIAINTPVLEITEEQWQNVLNINLSGVFYGCQAAARIMVKKGYGRLIMMSSVNGFKGINGRAPYAAAKGGLDALTRLMAVELGPKGITVNAVAPGPVDTEIARAMQTAEIRQKWIDHIPAHRYGTPEEVAAAVVFLASKEAAFVNGVTIPVDGGFVGAGLVME